MSTQVGKEMAAVRKIVYRFAGYDDENPPPEDLGLFDAIDMAAERLNRIEETSENAEIAAQSALGVAQARERADGGQTKKELAATKSRNELVRRVLVDNSRSNGALVTVRDVKEMCKPEVTVYQQTVEDGWDELVTRWNCFYRGSAESGVKALKIDKTDLQLELVHAVEDDLGRDDLSKRLLSRRGGKP